MDRPAFDALRGALDALPPAPPEGTVRLLVLRPARGIRLRPSHVHLSRVLGAAGDRWLDDPEPDAQITVMRADVASLLSPDGDIAAFGDNLFVDLDLSEGNLPAGTLLRVGAALCAVTPLPHDGCAKFNRRAVPEGLRLTATRDLRDHRLRGLHLRVIEDGVVRVGDPIRIERREERVGEQNPSPAA